MIDLNKLSKEVYENAKEHGFHDKEYSREHYMMLVITELSEAVEAHRRKKRADIKFYQYSKEADRIQYSSFELSIKDTVEDELADAVIRLLDYAGYRGEDIDVEYEEVVEMTNMSDKESFTESVYHIVGYIYDKSFNISSIIASIFGLCVSMNIDIEFHILEKMKYNKTREYKHGKKY